jgi:hypothetical protein
MFSVTMCNDKFGIRIVYVITNQPSMSVAPLPTVYNIKPGQRYLALLCVICTCRMCSHTSLVPHPAHTRLCVGLLQSFLLLFMSSVSAQVNFVLPKANTTLVQRTDVSLT